MKGDVLQVTEVRNTPESIQTIHDHDIPHNEIREENILFDNSTNNGVYLTDFVIAMMLRKWEVKCKLTRLLDKRYVLAPASAVLQFI